MSRLRGGGENTAKPRTLLSPPTQQLTSSPSTITSLHQTPPHLPSPSRTRQFFSAPPSSSTPTMPPPPPTVTSTDAIANTKTTNTGAAQTTQTAHEKMWYEMQQKLEEVSLSGDHVFGSTHSKSLADLRTAQVELAQAWMRSEEEDLDNKHTVFGRQAFAPVANTSSSTHDTAAAAASSSAAAAAAMHDHDEDLLLAGERRRANDAHFSRVAMSVVDVTRRLENVARAMAGVELESRGIWAGGSESEGSSLMS